MGHSNSNDSNNIDLDSTIPFTPIQFHDMFRYIEEEEQHRENLRIFDLE